MKFILIQNPCFKQFDELTYTIILDKIIGYTLYENKSLFEKIKNDIINEFGDGVNECEYCSVYIDDIKIKNADIESMYDENLNDEISISHMAENVKNYAIGEHEFRLKTNDDDIYIEFTIHISSTIENAYDFVKHILISIFKKYYKEIEKTYIMLQNVKTKVEIIDVREYVKFDISGDD